MTRFAAKPVAERPACREDKLSALEDGAIKLNECLTGDRRLAAGDLYYKLADEESQRFMKQVAFGTGVQEKKE